jgi:hypothetical protein
MAQNNLVIDGTKERASSIILSDNVVISSSQNGWSDINFEYHYQQAAFIQPFQREQTH